MSMKILFFLTVNDIVKCALSIQTYACSAVLKMLALSVLDTDQFKQWRLCTFCFNQKMSCIVDASSVSVGHHSVHGQVPAVDDLHVF